MMSSPASIEIDDHLNLSAHAEWHIIALSNMVAVLLVRAHLLLCITYLEWMKSC